MDDLWKSQPSSSRSPSRTTETVAIGGIAIANAQHSFVAGSLRESRGAQLHTARSWWMEKQKKTNSAQQQEINKGSALASI